MSANCPACGSPTKPIQRFGETAELCSACGSFFFPDRKNYTYADNYSETRGHQNQKIEYCKTASLKAQLNSAGIEISKQDRVLEVGFGGGTFLKYCNSLTDNIFGIEAQSSMIAQAENLGIPASNLSNELSAFEKHKNSFNKVFYFDSFEHLTAPKQHLENLNEYCSSGCLATLVLPTANSLSEKLMGSRWPHNCPDHWFFYSREGLEILWASQGWVLKKHFNPTKMINLEMIFRHLGIISFNSKLLSFTPNFWLNFGEMGMLFEKQ